MGNVFNPTNQSRFDELSESPKERCWVKIHHSRTGEIVVAVCDEELIERKLTLQGGVKVSVSKAFYGGVLIEVEELEKYIQQGTIINLLGQKAVETVIKMGLARHDAVVKIDGIPHLQIYL